MQRLPTSLSELKSILVQTLRQQPDCRDCRLHAVCVHRPDHTGCNWSAEVDIPGRDAEGVRGELRAARRVITLVRERYNVGASLRTAS
ncbi:hypothetical protein [Cupriavidus sp. AU9028]|uniref:hypothetical protein n=1 Tax=Cupriavidus sp. AU9028 TaxID=2871157 RepID=UPI001C93D358|nr:hypothetical protein [Cupriavidus sp. AU9028]MBY4896895.1 hypothetical protein [Cupriavidus sp. AU9028]